MSGGLDEADEDNASTGSVSESEELEEDRGDAKELDAEYLLKAAEVSKLTEIRKFDIIFERISDFGALRDCSAMKKISCIDNALPESVVSDTLLADPRGTSTHPVLWMSLQSLHLTKQGFSEIPRGLSNLKVLRELFLDNNEIRKIERLDGCKSLQKLWLHSNKITDLSGLAAVSSLEELWLQKNEIKSLQGLAQMGLNELHSLFLSGNPLEDLAGVVSEISSLPSLTSISFSELLFPASSLAKQSSYRALILGNLPNLAVLDGKPIFSKDRAAINDEFLESVRAFNLQLEVLRKQSRDGLKVLAKQRHQLDTRADTIIRQLEDSLAAVQQAVMDGRQLLEGDVRRVLRQREERLEEFEKTLNKLDAQHDKEVKSLMAGESKRHAAFRKDFAIFRKQMEIIDEEGRALEALEQRVQVDTSKGGSSKRVAQLIVAPLPLGTPDYSFAASTFADSFGTRQKLNRVTIHNIYSLANTGIAAEFQATVRQHTRQQQRKLQQSLQSGGKSDGEALPEVPGSSWLFFAGERERLHRVVSSGFAGLRGADDSGEVLALFDEAWYAHKSSGGSNSTGIFAMLLCRAAMLRPVVHRDNSQTAQLDPAEVLSDLPADCTIHCLENASGRRLFTLFDPTSCVPEFYIVYSMSSSDAKAARGPVVSAPTIRKKVQALLSASPGTTFPRLSRFDVQARDALQEFLGDSLASGRNASSADISAVTKRLQAQREKLARMDALMVAED